MVSRQSGVTYIIPLINSVCQICKTIPTYFYKTDIRSGVIINQFSSRLDQIEQNWKT